MSGWGQPSDLSRLFADLVEVVEPTLDAPEIARRVHRLVVSALAIDNAGIYLVAPGGGLAVAQGSLPDLPPEHRSLPADDPIVRRLVATRKPLRVPVDEHPNRAAAQLLAKKGVTRVVLTPFLAGERLLGLFACSRSGGNEIDDIADSVFEALGRIVSVALEHARLLGDARARAEADRALLDAARVATAGGDLDALLAKYAEALARAAGAAMVGIALPKAAPFGELRLAATYGTTPDELSRFASAPVEASDPVIARAYATRRLVRMPIADGTHEAAKGVLAARGIAHVFVLPLLARDAVKGIAFIAGVAAIEDARAAIVEAVGHEIALAIEAAENRDAARRRADRDSLEESIRGAVRASFDLTAILQGAVEKLGRALGAARCFVGAGVAGRTVYCITNEYRSTDELPPAIEWRFEGGDRPVARAAAKGEIVCHDVLTDSRFKDMAAVAPSDLRAFIVESFVVGEVWRGAITVGEIDRPRRWTEEEVRLVRAVADHCAIAARRAELHDDARRRASELELTISQMTDGVVMCNERLEVIRANAAAQQLLWGVAPDKAGTSSAMTVHDLDGRLLGPEQYPIVRAVRFGEVVRDRELVFRHAAEGQRRVVLSSASPIHDGTGRLVGGVVVMKDVTESRAAAAAASRTEKLRVVGELAASVAHDINNTLAAVLGSAELVATVSNQPEVRRNADTIAQAARDASVILGRLTRLSQRSHGSSGRDSVDLVQVADDAIELTRPRWARPDRGIAASLDAAEPAVRVRGIASELREVFTNLILNSVDAMPSGGAIKLRVARRGAEALVEVSDQGTGMSEDVLRHAFEPFFTTKGDAGTGLGLSISSAIVAAHEGRIDAESRIGVGTTIRIHFPIEALADAAAPRSGHRILVVDDDPRVRALLVDLLEADGHRVTSAGSGEEALELLSQEGAAADILVTDFLMPGMSGLVLADAARARHPKLGVVLVSGFCGDAPPADLERLGARVVTKPFRAEDLRAAVAGARAPVAALPDP